MTQIRECEGFILLKQILTTAPLQPVRWFSEISRKQPGPPFAVGRCGRLSPAKANDEPSGYNAIMLFEGLVYGCLDYCE